MVVNDRQTHLHSNGSESKLDLIIELEKTRRLSSPTTISVGYSDHHFVIAILDCARPIVPRVSYSYRDFRRMDVSAIAAYLQQIISSTCPPPDVDQFVSQLKTDISTGLDRFAPIRTKTKQPGRLGNRRLSTEANEAKKDRWRLERHYTRTRSPTDKAAYRYAYCKASALINNSRSAYLRGEVEQAAGTPRLLWKTIRQLLHPGPVAAWYEGLDTTSLASGLCASSLTRSDKSRIKLSSVSAVRPATSYLQDFHPSPPYQSCSLSLV